MTDYVQIPSNSTGDKIDVSKVAAPDGTIVDRQRIALSNPTDYGQPPTLEVLIAAQSAILEKILVELRIQNYMLKEGLNIRDTLTSMIVDFSEGISEEIE